MKINNRGFTLIEILLVIMIFSIISSVTFISLSSFYTSYERQLFLSQLENDLYYAQQIAISNSATTVFFINPSRKVYSIRQNNQVILERPLNVNVSFERGTLNLDDIRFLVNGNIGKPGTLLITVDDRRYALVFLLGKGRFYIEER